MVASSLRHATGVYPVLNAIRQPIDDWLDWRVTFLTRI